MWQSVDIGTYRYVVVVVQVPSDRKTVKGRIVKIYMYNRARLRWLGDKGNENLGCRNSCNGIFRCKT